MQIDSFFYVCEYYRIMGLVSSALLYICEFGSNSSLKF